MLRLYYSCKAVPSAICRSSTYLNLDVTKLQLIYKLYYFYLRIFMIQNSESPSVYILRSQRLGLKHCGSRLRRKKLTFTRKKTTLLPLLSIHRGRVVEKMYFVLLWKRDSAINRRMYRLFMIRLFVPCIYIYISVQHYKPFSLHEYLDWHLCQQF